MSVERFGSEALKTYRPIDPTGRWPSREAWLAQLSLRAEMSRQPCPIAINPVVHWNPKLLTAVSRWLEAVRPTDAVDVDAMKAAAPKWIGDIKAENIIVTEYGPVLIDFCVNHA